LDVLGREEDSIVKLERLAADAKSFRKVMADEKFTEELKELNEGLLGAPGSANVLKGLQQFEDLVNKCFPDNQGFSHAWREIFIDHVKNPSETQSIIIFLKCPKGCKLGFCYCDASEDSMTGLGAYSSILSFRYMPDSKDIELKRMGGIKVNFIIMENCMNCPSRIGKNGKSCETDKEESCDGLSDEEITLKRDTRVAFDREVSLYKRGFGDSATSLSTLSRRIRFWMKDLS
jgi:hypothetical protein